MDQHSKVSPARLRARSWSTPVRITVSDRESHGHQATSRTLVSYKARTSSSLGRGSIKLSEYSIVASSAAAAGCATPNSQPWP